MRNNFLKHFGWILGVVLLSWWAVKPLTIQGFFPMHDDTQVARVYEMGKALHDGMFPVRWVADLGYGYGYPIFNFYAPLAYYVGGLLNVVGLDALIATKLMMAIGILLAGVFMYLLAKEFFGNLGGVVAAMFYMYAPYHAIEIYIRGDVAEFWAYAFIPLGAYGVWKAYQTMRFRYVVLGAIGIAGMVLSHNLTAMMIMPFLVTLSLTLVLRAWAKKKYAKSLYPIITLMIGMMLSAFYFAPALLEMRYTDVFSQIGGGADFRDHFVYVQQLWDSPWGFGGSAKGLADGLSFRIGKLHIIFSLLALLSLLLLFIKGKKHSKQIAVVSISIIGLAISIFLTLEISRPIWEMLSPMAFFQYPWRFLILISFFSSMLSGVSVWYLQNYLLKGKLSCVLLLLSVPVLLLYTKHFVPQTITYKSVSDYTSRYELLWVASKVSDEYLPKGFQKPQVSADLPGSRITLQSNAKITQQIDKTQMVGATIIATKEATVRINIARFPAWNFTMPKNSNVIYTDNGVVLRLPTGSSRIEASYNETLVEKIANMVSMSGILLIFLGIIHARRRASL